MNTTTGLETYTQAAKLYEQHRPKYPKELLDIANVDGMKILELGCGPGTLTLDLLKRGCHVTAIEPGSGMMAEARKVCRDFETNIRFHQTTLRNVPDGELDQGSFDAVMAASAFHWAMKDDEDLVARCHGLLKPGGRLILLWNLPYEPKNTAINDKVAELTGADDNLLYFGSYSLDQHSRNIREVIEPITANGLFSKFSEEERAMEKDFKIEDYGSFLKTLGPYIRMPKAEVDDFISKMNSVMKELSEDGSHVPTKSKSIMNISFKI